MEVISKGSPGERPMVNEPKLNREFQLELEKEIEKEGRKLEKTAWGSKAPFKDFEELAEFLERVFASLSENAAIALYCLRKGYNIDFYERIKQYLLSIKKS